MSLRSVDDFCCFVGCKVFKLNKLVLLRARPSMSVLPPCCMPWAFILARCAVLLDRSMTLSRSHCCSSSKFRWHFSRKRATSSIIARYICRLFSTFKVQRIIKLCKHLPKVIGIPVVIATEASQSLFAAPHSPRHCCTRTAASRTVAMTPSSGASTAAFGSPRWGSDTPETAEKKEKFSQEFPIFSPFWEFCSFYEFSRSLKIAAWQEFCSGKPVKLRSEACWWLIYY